MVPADEIKNVLREIYAKHCGKADCREITVSLDPKRSSYIVKHEKKETHVKIPARFFYENSNNLPIVSLRNFLNKL